MNRAILALSLCIILAVIPPTMPGAGAQITKLGDAYQFRIKFTKGATIKFNMVSIAQAGGPAPVKVDMPFGMTVKSVQDHIAAVSLDMGPMLLNGKPGPRPKQTIEVKLNDRGKAIQTPTSAQGGMPNIGQLPEKPLKIGESFEASNSVDVMGQKLEVKSTYKFLGIKTTMGKPAALLSSTTVGIGAMSIKGSGMAYVSMEDGSLLSMKSSQQITISQGGSAAPIKLDVTITRK